LICIDLTHLQWFTCPNLFDLDVSFFSKQHCLPQLDLLSSLALDTIVVFTKSLGVETSGYELNSVNTFAFRSSLFLGEDLCTTTRVAVEVEVAARTHAVGFVSASAPLSDRVRVRMMGIVAAANLISRGMVPTFFLLRCATGAHQPVIGLGSTEQGAWSMARLAFGPILWRTI
jgi:hypothetical protein